MDKLLCENSWIGNIETLQAFRIILITWGQVNFRAFPWRLTHDPYIILVAELMLHRTQVIQVVPVFQTFITRYPDIQHLAQADRSELQEVLSPLGLRWRINLIYDMVQQIAGQFAMRVPVEKVDLLSLPGVSEYIAGAVRCFAWNLPEPLIDTNTVRITGRVLGLETKDSSRRNTRFRELITALLDTDDPRIFNYALLDLAHLICLKKQEPLCQECPILAFCCLGQSKVDATVMVASGR